MYPVSIEKKEKSVETKSKKLSVVLELQVYRLNLKVPSNTSFNVGLLKGVLHLFVDYYGLTLFVLYYGVGNR